MEIKSDIDETTLTLTKSSKLILINLYIKKAEDEYSFSITNSAIVETTKNIIKKETDKWLENDFVCFIIDDSKNIIDTLHLSQPLHPRFEYPGDDGIIKSEVIEMNEINVLLRFSYSERMKYLQINKVKDNHIPEKLKTIEITVIQ